MDVCIYSLAHLVDKLRVVRDDDDAAVVGVDGLGECAERVAVQIVGRLVKNHDVRRVPHGRCEDNLDLHAHGKELWCKRH
eukprot:6180202-Pleurochrysis_carterae.AAC.1